MPSQFPQWLMRDGVTRLGGAYFNPIWASIDVRLLALEAMRTNWEQAVLALTETGISRIEDALSPLIAQISAETAALVADVEAARAALEGDMEDLPGLRWVTAAYGESYAYDAQGRIETISEMVVDEPRETQYTYDGQGRIETITTTYQGYQRTHTLIYNASGLLTGSTCVEGSI